MKPLVAKSADCLLGLSLLAVALSTAMWMLNGGSDGHFHDLRWPLLAAGATLSLWTLLHPDTLQHWAHRWQNAPHLAVAWGLGAVTASVLCVLKLWQHYALYTNGFDLAEYTNIAWNVAHGYGFWSSLEQEQFLGDHFDPIFLLLAPIVSWAQSGVPLLLLQCAALGLAVTALYLLCLRHLEQKWLAPVFAVLLAFNQYLHQVSSYDFHEAAFAIPLFLWIMYCADTDRWAAVLLLATVVMLVEETIVLPLAGAGLYMAIYYPRRRAFGWVLFTISVGWFLAAVTVWMPLFQAGHHPTHIDRYGNLGGTSFHAILHNLAQHPRVLAHELTTPVKLGALNSLLLSVGYLPLLAPRAALLMVAPALIMSSSGYSPQYTYTLQYSSAILPFLFYAAVAGAGKFPWPSARWLPALAAALLCLNIFRTPDYVGDWSSAHVTAVYQLMAQVPPQADLCATQYLLPHLCTRQRFSEMGGEIGERSWQPARSSLPPVLLKLLKRPLITMVWGHGGGDIITHPWKYADYVLLDAPSQGLQHSSPLDPWQYSMLFDASRASAAYELIDEKDGAVLLRRRPRQFARLSVPDRP